MEGTVYQMGQYPPDLKNRIAEVLSSILSDKYDCKVTLRFVPKEEHKAKERLQCTSGISV